MAEADHPPSSQISNLVCSNQFSIVQNLPPARLYHQRHLFSSLILDIIRAELLPRQIKMIIYIYMLNHDFTFVFEHFQGILAPNLKKENSLEKTTIITWLPLIVQLAWLLWQLDFSYFLPTTERTKRLKVLCSLVIKRGYFVVHWYWLRLLSKKQRVNIKLILLSMLQ